MSQTRQTKGMVLIGTIGSFAGKKAQLVDFQSVMLSFYLISNELNAS